MFKLRYIILATCMSLSACTSPLEAGQDEDPVLQEIRREFAAVVQQAHDDQEVEWVFGWGGNSAIKEAKPGTTMGYCYEWQELLEAKLSAKVEALGWALVKININHDWFSEHHAVIVFDPREISQEELLVKVEPAYVLDAWQRGEADIYHLRDWLSIPVIVFEQAALELKDGSRWRP